MGRVGSQLGLKKRGITVPQSSKTPEISMEGKLKFYTTTSC